MRTTIWKFPLRIEGRLQTAYMPHDSVVLRFAIQRGCHYVWAEVDPESKKVLKEFVIVGTGGALPGGLFCYVGTCDDGLFVWHLYMNTPNG